MRLKVIEYLKGNESPKAKFILKKMVMFPNDQIQTYLKEIPCDKPVENIKIHEETQIKFENSLNNDKNLKRFITNDLKVFLEKVPKANVFEYLQLYFE